MHEGQIEPTSIPSNGGQLQEAVTRLESIVLDGLRHGFFECSVTCEIGKGGKRQLVIRAGRSYKFTIHADEIPR